MNSFKVFTKEYSGHDYKKLRSGALLSVILFCSVYFSEIKLPIAPKIMHLMAFSFTAGIMLQTLSSNKNRESLSEIFTLPFWPSCLPWEPRRSRRSLCAQNASLRPAFSHRPFILLSPECSLILPDSPYRQRRYVPYLRQPLSSTAFS